MRHRNGKIAIDAYTVDELELDALFSGDLNPDDSSLDLANCARHIGQ